MPTMEEILERQFNLIGARVHIERRVSTAASVSIRRVRRGEYFDLVLPESAAGAVLDADRPRRHLLILLNLNGEKSRYLCGHDERHWFVAAIPESERGVVNVSAAKFALMPPAVRDAAGRIRVRHRHRRRNAAYVRQGEWFFIPAPTFHPNPWTVRRNEPLSRGRGTPHTMEFAHRSGGTVVLVSRQYPKGLTFEEFDALPVGKFDRGGWRRMVRDAEVHATGRISHPDHATLHLEGWHRVYVNTESDARAMRQLAFLD